MANVLLLRTESSEQGTFGILVFNDEYLHTAELPWKGNKPNISCIPEGTYQVSMRVSPKYGQCFIVAVEGRSYILFHNGNWAGDKSLGLRSNTNGCILLGQKRGRIYKQQAVLASRTARTIFESEMDFEPFELEVKNLWNG